MKFNRIACIADKNIKAQKTLDDIIASYGFSELIFEERHKYDLIIVLGGDGFMLHMLHKYMDLKIPFFGINIGHEGFLLNSLKDGDLLKRITNSTSTKIRPLKMRAECEDGKIEEKIAINEVSLLRSSPQAAKLKIYVNDEPRLLNLVCDGVIVATPAGSSAYNFSVGGSILPLNANILSLMPISPFRPRRWGGALLPHKAKIRVEVIESKKRPVNAFADFVEIEDIISVTIEENNQIDIELLFDKEHSLEDRLIKEQFYSSN